MLGATYHVQADDLTGGLLDLLQTPHEIPVTRLGDDLIGGEDAHAVQSRGGVGLCRQVPADDLVLLETTWLEDMLANGSFSVLVQAKSESWKRQSQGRYEFEGVIDRVVSCAGRRR